MSGLIRIAPAVYLLSVVSSFYYPAQLQVYGLETVFTSFSKVSFSWLLLQDTDLKGSSVTGTVGNVKK